MGLITKEVDVKIAPANKQYFVKMGYIDEFFNSKAGKYIKVNVKDLSEGSHCLVEWECDNCNKIYSSQYRAYLRYLHEDGKTYCMKCSHKVLMTRENHPNWNPNKTDEERITERYYNDYTKFVRKVLNRDNYTCICCDTKGGNLVVHHLDSYDWCKDKRTESTNGVTLCEKCHKNFHIKYGYGNNTKEQFEEWMDKEITNMKSEEYVPYQTVPFVCVDTREIITNFVEYKRKNKGVILGEIHKCCNGIIAQHKGNHYMWKDKFDKMSEDDIEEYLFYCNIIEQANKSKDGVVCLNENKVFYSQKLASLYYGINKAGISSCCNNNQETSGEYNGKKLKLKPLKLYMKENNIISLKQLKETCNIIPIEECKNKLL